jgi:putative ABC transport system permease protein
VAVLVARAGVPALMRAAPDEITVWAAHAVGVDWRVAAFAAWLTALLGLVFALLPAWGAARTTSRSASSAVGVHALHTPARRRVRFALLTGEVMLTFVLLAGAALLTRSFVRLANVDPGFNPDGLAMVSLELSEATYRTADDRAAFWRELESRLEAMPGVAAVTIGSLPPEADVRVGALLQADDDAAPREDSPLLLPHSDVSLDYLPTLGVRLAAGRNFLPEEGSESHVAIIDRDMARFLFGEADPVNRRFRFGEKGSWRQVVGVVDDLKLGGPDDSLGAFVLLEPYGPAGYDSAFGDVAVRVAGDPEAILPLIRQTVSTIDPRQPLYSLQTADRVLAEVVADRRFFLTVITTLGVLSVGLAGVGMYGLLAFLVARRRREIGIRVALGASGRTVAAAVLRSGLGATALGCALGLLVAIWAGRLVQHLLFETEPSDTASLAAVTALLLAVSVVASLIPARRAAQADPIEALRAE